MSRVKKLCCAGLLVLGVLGTAAPAMADPIIHEEVTVDPDYLPVGPLVGVCVTIGRPNPPTCIVI